MAAVSVGATPTRIDLPMDATPIIQNLGPDPIYWDTEDTDPVANGIRIAVDQAYEPPGDLNQLGSIWLAAETEGNDVRVVRAG